MSIVLSGSPDTFAPVYNPVVFYPSSTNALNEGFKYITSIFSAGTTTPIAVVDSSPRPGDYLGVVNIGPILESQVGSFLDTNPFVFSACPENFVNYYVNFQEEFVTYFRITGGTVGATTASTKFDLNLSGITQQFIVGDLVDIVDAYLPYVGTYNVLGITGNTVEVGVEYDIPPSSGFFVFSSRAKTRWPISVSGLGLSGLTAFNGAIQHQEFMQYSGSSYNMINTIPGNWITNYPDCFRIREDNCLMLFNLYSTTMNADIGYLQVTTPFTQQILPNALSGQSNTMLSVNVAPCNLSNENITGSTIVLSGGNELFTNTSYEFFDNGAANTIGFSGGNVMYLAVQSDAVVRYPIGSIVNVQQTPPFTNPSYNGLQTVVSSTTINGINYLITDVPFGQNSPAEGGTVSQVTTYYDVQIIKSTGATNVSNSIRICLDDRCDGKFPNVELLFEDLKGGYTPANFNLLSSEQINIGRTEYQQYLGNLTNGKYGYNSIDKGRTISNVNVVTEITANSNYLTESEGLYLKQLFTSPRVYVKQNGEYWPIVITSNQLQVTKKYNKKNFYYSITFQMANNDTINI
jgi:hypothetical protein